MLGFTWKNGHNECQSVSWENWSNRSNNKILQFQNLKRPINSNIRDHLDEKKWLIKFIKPTLNPILKKTKINVPRFHKLNKIRQWKISSKRPQNSIIEIQCRYNSSKFINYHQES